MDDSEEEIKQNSQAIKVKRTIKISVWVKCVKFSPDGKQFCVSTTEGVLIYSNDHTEIFLPLDIDEDITLEKLISQLKKQNYMWSLLMALKLNNAKVIHKTIQLIPEAQIPIIA